MPKVLIADDHPLFRDAIRDVVAQVFAARGWAFVCQEATRLDEAAAVAEQDEELDLILLDLSMPDAGGLSTLVSLRAKAPATPIVVVSSMDDPATVRQTIACGAAGFIPKSSSKELIAAALEAVFAGGVWLPPGLRDEADDAQTSEDRAAASLTQRQLAVLDLLARGLSNKLIARDLAISDMTVKAHVTAILRKLGVTSRAQAIVMFRQQQAPRQVDA